jgi:isopropylmalate/homocitrate/citramalate synthase
MAKKKLTSQTDMHWLPEYNYLDEIRNQFHLPEKVNIHDVTLREAEQAPHVVLRPDEKMRIFEALDEMGVYSVELLPLFSEDDRNLAYELIKKKRRAKVFFLCRWAEKEVDFALEAGADGIVIECAAFPFLGKLVWDLDENQMIERLTRVTKYAKKHGIYTCVMPWDTLKGSPAFLERLYKSVVNEGGADHITVADTFGPALPWTVTYIVKKLREWVPGTPIEWHCHNDFGLATAAMLAAVSSGVSTVHTAMNALGERAGNAATEEVVVNLELQLGVDTGIKMDKLYSTSMLVSELAKMPLPRNKPVVGDNEFTYESGMVCDMVLRTTKAGQPTATEPFAPQLIGRKGYDIILGKGTGRTVVMDRLDKLGYTATKEQTAQIVEAVKREAGIRKWSISEAAFEDIVREILKDIK